MRWLKLFFPFIIAIVIVGIIVADNMFQRTPAKVTKAATSVKKKVATTIHPKEATDPVCGMSVTVVPDTAKREWRGKIHYFCHEGCAVTFSKDHEHEKQIAESQPAAAPHMGELDPVCHMLVGKQIPAEYEGKSYYFCAPQCRDQFLAAPASYMGIACPVCEVDDDKRVLVDADTEWVFTWQEQTYRFCSVDHRTKFSEDPGGYFLHRMWGIPNGLYYLSIALVMLISFGLLELIDHYSPKTPNPLPNHDRIDLLAWKPIRRLVSSRFLRFIVQGLVVILFFMIIFAGLFGSQQPSRNIAPILTWTIWWAGLVVVILYAGKAFCWACPWDAFSSWIERLTFWKRSQTSLGLGLKWPPYLRNIILATVLFVGLTWFELGFGVTLSPASTAYLGLAMLACAFASVLVFERKSYCRYACLVGRVSGLYAMFSPVEMRSKSEEVCTSCTTKDCFTGNENGYGCPTFEFPSKMNVNTYCTMCTECLSSCPHDNMTINLRPWGSDIVAPGKPRTDEAYLALLMLSITGFHGLTMTGLWLKWTQQLSSGLNLPFTAAFSLGMFGLMAAPILLYAGLVWISKCIVDRGKSANGSVTYQTYFIRYAYALLPIALFYHLAHNAGHLLMEGQKVLPMLSNPFGFVVGESWNVMGITGMGPWDLLGTLSWHVPPLISLPSLWLIQVLLVLVGHVYSLWAAQRISKQLFPDHGDATRSQIPMLVAMILFSIFSLWLLKQPMEMRLSAM